MNCIFAIEGRFILNNGRPASTHSLMIDYGPRYLQVFDSVTVIGRLFPIENPGSFRLKVGCIIFPSTRLYRAAVFEKFLSTYKISKISMCKTGGSNSAWRKHSLV